MSKILFKGKFDHQKKKGCCCYETEELSWKMHHLSPQNSVFSIPLSYKGLLLQWEEPKSPPVYLASEARGARVQGSHTKTPRGSDLLIDHLGAVREKWESTIKARPWSTPLTGWHWKLKHLCGCNVCWQRQPLLLTFCYCYSILINVLHVVLISYIFAHRGRTHTYVCSNNMQF